MTTQDNVLEIENLSIAFRSAAALTPIVRNVSLSIPRGKTLALVGESGSGKTTLAQSIMGLMPHTASVIGGAIRLCTDGTSYKLTSMPPRSQSIRRLRGRRMGMIFQEPSAALSPVHTIGDLLIESLRTHRSVTLAEARERAAQALARVGFDRPTEGLAKYPFELSGGLRQRAMVAAALMCEPALLIADEPTSALDVTVQALLLNQIALLQDEMGMSMLLITHDLGVVASVAEETAVLYRGEVMERGPTRDLLKDPQHPYLKALMRAGPSAARTTERLVPLRPIPPPTEEFRARWSRPHMALRGAPLLSLDKIVKRYEGRGGAKTLAVNSVSITIQQGECLGLVGESGCGKSTLCRVLMQAVQPDSGGVQIYHEGTLKQVAQTPRDDFRQRVQYVFQDPFGSLNPRHTVRDILAEPFEIHRIGTPKEHLQWAEELLTLVGLPKSALGRFPNAFSGGQRQRIAIARALALRPDLVVCDEPVSALDVSVQAQILNLLKDLQSGLGVSYLFVSHDLGVIRHIADRVAVMCRGRIVELASVETLFSDPRHPYTRALLAAAPEADPDKKLDLSALLDGRASDPEAWDPPYRLLGDAIPRYDEVSSGHFVAVA
jgi:peptide/nickel transport system ATP-binding protein